MRFAGQGPVAQPTGDWKDKNISNRIAKQRSEIGRTAIRDWARKPTGTLPVEERIIMKPIGTEHPLDQPAGLDPYHGMNKVEVAGGFNLFNPFDWRKTGEVRDRIQSGDPNLEFEEGPLGTYGKRIRDQQEFLRQHGML